MSKHRLILSVPEGNGHIQKSGSVMLDGKDISDIVTDVNIVNSSNSEYVKVALNLILPAKEAVIEVTKKKPKKRLKKISTANLMKVFNNENRT